MKSLDLEAGDLDGDDALQDQVEVHLGSDGHLLLESDLDLQGDGGAVLDQDWEGGNGHHVKCDWFRAAICLKQKNLSHLTCQCSPQNPYSSSVGGASRLSLRSLPEAAATRKARAKNFMARPRWTLGLRGHDFYLLFQEISFSYACFLSFRMGDV